MRRAGAIAVAALAALAAAAPAQAATVSFDGSTVRVTAAPGESNGVSIGRYLTFQPDGSGLEGDIGIRDTAGLQPASPQCASRNSEIVVCDSSPGVPIRAEISTGDLSDRVMLDEPVYFQPNAPASTGREYYGSINEGSDMPSTQIELGDGDDLFQGTSSDTSDSAGVNDTVDGGPGNDEIRPMGGGDSISGGDGDDELIDGGIDSRADGAETFSGGPGDDFIFSGSSWNWGSQRVTTSGGEGDDEIQSGSGIADMDGGPGDDELFPPTVERKEASKSARHTIAGGDGRDYVFQRGLHKLPKLVPSTIKTGPDSDRVRIELNITGDKVNCGPAKDKAAGNREDKFKACEKVTYPKPKEGDGNGGGGGGGGGRP